MRIRRPLTALAAAVAATALGLSLAGPATAAREVHRDPAGDTVDFVLPTSAAARARPADGADVVRIVTSYKPNRITVTTELVEIADDNWSVGAVLRTPAGRSTMSYVDRAGMEPFVVFNPPPSAPGRARAGLGECNPVATISRRQDLVSLAIDPRCAGAGAWVRTAVGAVRFIGDRRAKADDARRNGRANPTVNGLELGPKVRRG